MLDVLLCHAALALIPPRGHCPAAGAAIQRDGAHTARFRLTSDTQ